MNYRSINEKRCAIKSNVLIVGIDIAKFKHVARAVRPDHTFTNSCYFTNDIHGFTRLLTQTSRWLRSSELTEVIFGMEPTGHYFKPLARWLERQGFKIVLVAPRDVSRQKEGFNNSPTKADPKDAILIADLVSQGQYFPARLAKGSLANLQRLVHHRWQLVKDLTRMLNRLQADLDERFPEFAAVYGNLTTNMAHYLVEHYSDPTRLKDQTVDRLIEELRRLGSWTVNREKLQLLLTKAAESIGSAEGWDETTEVVVQNKLKIIGLLKKQLAALEGAIERLVATFEDTKYLTSLRGIGLISAACYIAETGGLGNYRSGDAVVKMAGLDLTEASSGESRGRRHVSHYGRSLLRTTAYFDALVQTRRGMPLHDLYCQLVKKGKPKLQALIAVASAILRLEYALVRDKRYYTAEPPSRQIKPAA
jgi:transposase